MQQDFHCETTRLRYDQYEDQLETCDAHWQEQAALMYPRTKVGHSMRLNDTAGRIGSHVTHGGTVKVQACHNPYGVTQAHEVAGTRDMWHRTVIRQAQMSILLFLWGMQV